MPERRRLRSDTSKPAGSMISTGHAEAGGQAQHGAGVLRDVGLVDSETQHGHGSVIAAQARTLVSSSERFGRHARVQARGGAEWDPGMMSLMFDWLESRIDLFAPFNEEETPPGTVARSRGII